MFHFISEHHYVVLEKEVLFCCTWKGSRYRLQLSLVIFWILLCVKVRNLLTTHTSHILLDETMAETGSEKWRSTATNQFTHEADREMSTGT